MDDIPKSAAWILSGSSAAAAIVALIGLAPRVASAYPAWLRVAIVLILIGFMCGAIAVMFYLIGVSRSPATRNNGWALAFIAAGMACVVGGTAVLAIAYQQTLSTHDVPRLTLSVSSAGEPQFATVKVKFEADELNPGQFIVVDMIAVARDTVAKMPAGVGQVVPGHRFYRAAIGSDSTGKVTSEVDTNIRRGDYGLVVAEVWPGPLNADTLAPNNQQASTRLCSDIVKSEVRSCAYAEVPI
jgi:hypothetical protein